MFRDYQLIERWKGLPNIGMISKCFRECQVFGELPSKAIYEQLLHLLLDIDTKFKIHKYLWSYMEEPSDDSIGTYSVTPRKTMNTLRKTRN